jgi:two-component system sensor histidine kinase KdpD
MVRVTGERVVVALSGAPDGERLVRRAAALAGADGVLLAVHVARSDGLSDAGYGDLAAQRLLVESFGGSYHSLVGDDVPAALLAFARRLDATQVVLGNRGGRPGRIARRLGAYLDVHLAGQGRARVPSLPRPHRGVPRRRLLAGLATAVVLLLGGTFALVARRSDVSFAADVALYLLAVVITAVVGGFWPAIAAARASSMLLNYYFVPPIHAFSIDRKANLLALVVFLVIAVLVSQVVTLAARRSSVAARASAEAETVSTFAGDLMRGGHTLEALLERVRETFAMSGGALLARDGEGWRVLARAGEHPQRIPADADTAASVDADRVLALTGRALPPEDRGVLAALAAHLVVAHRQQELAEAARDVEVLTSAERARTALLNAVSHDLRTPIASAKTAVSSLRAADVTWSDADRAELLATADSALDRLADLVTNLLDLSRLQAGALPVLARDVGLDDIVARALAHMPPAAVAVDIADDLPAAHADAGLLERVVANLLQNALRYAPDGCTVTGTDLGGRVELRVVDTGSGLNDADPETLFAPFQRGHDAPADGAGLGLGLAIARGFTEAMAGTLTAEPTPGGGATFVVSLPVATGTG